MTVSPAAKPHTLISRPEWTCDLDGLPYPCEEAREDLLARYAGNRPGLRNWMTQCRDQFVADNPTLAAEADARFIDWLPEEE